MLNFKRSCVFIHSYTFSWSFSAEFLIYFRMSFWNNCILLSVVALALFSWFCLGYYVVLLRFWFSFMITTLFWTSRLSCCIKYSDISFHSFGQYSLNETLAYVYFFESVSGSSRRIYCTLGGRAVTKIMEGNWLDFSPNLPFLN